MAKKYQMSFDAKTMIKDQSLLRHEDIKQHILILPELAAYIPPLLPNEYNQLEENIKQNGCREALLVWETVGDQVPGVEETSTVYILVDGHNRYAICQEYHVDFKVHVMNFQSIEQVRFFMIDNQLGRRNLSPEQVAYLRGLRYLHEKKEKGKYNRDEQKGHSDLYGEGDAQNGLEISKEPVEDSQQTTAHRLGKQFNVSEKTIKRDSIYAQGLEKLAPTFRRDILAGTTKVDKALIQQFGQYDISNVLISNIAELEDVIKQTKDRSKFNNAKKQPKKNAVGEKLRGQLRQLVEKLDGSGIDMNQVCDEIIECARKLKQKT
ncbi:hypothetical protein [Spirosoma spitsbergense]|uniref:hypothetical protein n=1 Tax=Spirosoma spitsbergense TaxID=431554 RepID=UPI000365E019|nr:hypothetical protein [Spirosoma spitsbergense]